MQLLGRVVECMIIDKCLSSRNLNILLMNIALLKKDIGKEYSSVDYDKYIPFSSSHKYILISENGVLRRQPIINYNPTDPNMDIAWCKRKNVISQLKLDLANLDYLENARLQIKTSLNYENVDLNNKYYITPIIYFDLCNDVHMLRRKYPNHYIISAREIDPLLMNALFTSKY